MTSLFNIQKIIQQFTRHLSQNLDIMRMIKRLRAIRAAGKLSGPSDLSINHDDYLAEVYSEIK
jgi:hypothetical protein